jgi:hypothetical protein
MLQVWLGTRSQPDFYNRLRRHWPWWDIALKELAKPSAADDARAFTLTPSATPGAFETFRRWPEAGLSSVPFHRYWRLEVGDETLTRRLLSLASPARDGMPAGTDAAVIEMRVGAGAVVVFAMTPDLAWTRWPLHASFVPGIQGLVWEHVRQKRDVRVMRVGELATLPGRSLASHTTVSLRAPDGQLEVLTQARDEAGVALVPLLQGLYRDDAARRVAEETEWLVGQRQPAGADESDPRLLGIGDLRATFPNVAIHALSPSLAAAGPRSASGMGARWFLVLAIALVAVELMLAALYVERAAKAELAR